MEKMYSVIRENGWAITEDNGDKDGIELELSQFTPASQDFLFSVFFDGTAEDLIEKIGDYYEDFDVDEHVEMWLEARRNGVRGVPSARTLVYDAEAIEEMLKELFFALKEQYATMSS